jgi:two-component system NtrC family sensor kinase
VRVSELIDNVLSLYERRLNSLGIAVDTRYETDVLVNAFPGELRRYSQTSSSTPLMRWRNRATNSASTSSRLSLGRIQLKQDYASRYLDNGSGIPADKRKQIFEPFYTTKGNKGTGIGLWVCLGIVQKYGGKMRLRSDVKPGHSGTTFSVFLPVVPEPSNSQVY